MNRGQLVEGASRLGWKVGQGANWFKVEMGIKACWLKQKVGRWQTG